VVAYTKEHISKSRNRSQTDRKKRPIYHSIL
jgi:hypothetical protein